ncbi:MAG: nitrilase-related carbon-nitrogen hydrolase [Bacteroidota bacterium]|nr:nitrilase-related carbon-nitrogen hydrolase [Bacteroidota bacterium]
MQIAVVQMQPQYGNIHANVNRVCELLSRADAAVVVFPELALSGYFFTDREQLRNVALELNSPALQTIEQVATAQRKVAIVGFPEQAGERIYNSAVLYDGCGGSYIYRKTHLFYRERLVFDEGDTGFFVIAIDWLDVRIGMMICYDWRFPEAARTLALQGADVIVCPSNLVTHVWRMAMPVRALENKVYVAVANRIGKETQGEETLEFNGHSAIYGYNGTLLAELPSDTEGIAVASIEPALTRSKSFNQFNDIFADRRPWAYRLSGGAS